MSRAQLVGVGAVAAVLGVALYLVVASVIAIADEHDRILNSQFSER